MLNSKERIDFITKYLSAYKEQIELSNSRGLYDSAKFFENFACELCILWFDQSFTNLNDAANNYPYVDLVSQDGQIYVQVSTAKDIPSKIKNTLNKLKDTKDSRFKSVRNVVFFVLGNDSVDNVVDYTGVDQIGEVSFTQKDNLITTADILQKAIEDFDFQCKLYNIIKRDVDCIESVFGQLENAFSLSKTAILNNIDVLINGEYYIDRSELVSKIKQCDKQFVCIQGGPGTGKSVICRKIVEYEDRVLFVRAEKIAQSNNLVDIWGVDIEKALLFWSDKKLTIFIDALEFIADAPKTQLDILFHLYEIAKQNSFVKIISSCRTSDKNAFLKLDSTYNIVPFELDYLNNGELKSIANKYDVIREMMQNPSYSALLVSPFYVNLIINKIKSINDIHDETHIRDLIWKDVICLQSRSKDYDLDSIDVLTAVNTIVFERAKKFALGVSKDKFASKIVDALFSEGVIVEYDGMLRLKYDIFEDICFEHYFDIEFIGCKGNYIQFFAKIEELGRCVYRRYQIWVSNKIFTKSNRDKFLHSLVFSEQMPIKWREQTIIGISKSKYCEPFFEEYGDEIIVHNALADFINITNLYGFEARTTTIDKHSFLVLSPIGYGRDALIELVNKRELYKSADNIKEPIVKLCSDYSNSRILRKKTADYAARVLEYHVESFLTQIDADKRYKRDEYLWELVCPIYKMSQYTKEWIIGLWDRLKENVFKTEENTYLFSRVLIDKTIEAAPYQIYKYMTKDICALVEFFWTYNDAALTRKIGYGVYGEDSISRCYGLNHNADRYSHDVEGLSKSNFMKSIFSFGEFYTALSWTIKFINKCVSKLVETVPDYVLSTEVYFPSTGKTKNYYGSEAMWISISEEYQVPIVISDLAYSLKEFLCQTVEYDYTEGKKTNDVLQGVRDIVYQGSNNVILLSMIASVAMQFPKKLPGLVIDLASSIDIVLWDLSRYGQIMQKYNPIIQGLKKSMFLSVGMPNMKMRYENGYSHENNLIEYVFKLQLQSDGLLIDKCHKILDYLYERYPNNEENAHRHLQIQRMDLRTAQLKQVDDETYAIIPGVNGASQKLCENKPPQVRAINRINELTNEFTSKTKNKDLDINYVLSTIEELEKITTTVESARAYSQVLILFIGQALAMPDLPIQKREEFCDIWIKGIRSIMNYGAFVFDYGLSLALFAQLEQKISKSTKNKIKELMLDCIMFEGQEGIINGQIVPIIKLFLSERKQLSSVFVNTIIKLAEDEMNHQKHNAKYAKAYYMDRYDEEYVPNLYPQLQGVDEWLINDKHPLFKSRRNKIIKDYLFDENAFDLSKFSFDDYYIRVLMYISNCGLDLKDEQTSVIVKAIISKLIDLWRTHHYRWSEVVSTHAYYEFIYMFKESIAKNLGDISCVCHILFDDKDFVNFPGEGYEFYRKIFSELLLQFFDSHSNVSLRTECKKAVLQLEDTINNINCEKSKIELYKSVILTIRCDWGFGDWSECKAGYSYLDKQFLNEQFSKYGKYHLEDIVQTIYKLHYDKLLPEVLISLAEVFEEARVSDKKYANTIYENRDLISLIITDAFLNHSDSIKMDEELTKSFEAVLEQLISLSFENAAVILDEFRIH